MHNFVFYVMGECVTLLTRNSTYVLRQVNIKKAVSSQQHASAVLMRTQFGDYSTIQLTIPYVITKVYAAVRKCSLSYLDLLNPRKYLNLYACMTSIHFLFLQSVVLCL